MASKNTLAHRSQFLLAYPGRLHRRDETRGFDQLPLIASLLAPLTRRTAQGAAIANRSFPTLPYPGFQSISSRLVRLDSTVLCHSPRAKNSAPMKSSPQMGPAAWAKCKKPATPASTARSRSKFCLSTLPSARTSGSASSAEARAVASLNHPNICVLYDIGSQDGMGYQLAFWVVSRFAESCC